MDYTSFRKLRNSANSSTRVGFRRVDYRCLLADKFAFGKYLASLNFPTPAIQGLIKDSMILWDQNRQPEGLSTLVEKGDMDCFLKDITGQCAIGVHKLKVEKGKAYLDQHPVEAKKLNVLLGGSWIIQPCIKQHSLMSLLYPDSVNTIRLVTISKDADPQPFSALIRIGAHGNFCDNWAIGGLLGSVDINKGTISKYCIFKPGYGQSVCRHPETNIVFENFVVPYFRQAVEMACQLHRYFYGIHSIGWDIAITPTGPIFIEGNDNWEISMHQALEGPLKEKFMGLLPKV